MIATVTTQPAEEPVTLTEAKAHLRVSDTADDTYITAIIKAAREQAERFVNGAIVTQTLTGKLDQFFNEISLPSGPIAGITSISYIDTDGETQTVDSSIYTLDAPQRRILLAYNQEWPDTRCQKNAVTVVFTAGVAVADVPQSIKQAILLLVGEMYENREETVIGVSASRLSLTAERLLQPFKIYR